MRVSQVGNPRKGGRMQRMRRVLVASVFASAGLLVETPAEAATTVCGPSGSHTVCITLPAGALSGEVTVGISNAPNGGKMQVTWVTSRGTVRLLTRFQPSAQTQDYSFVWPTQKYLDASGTLKAKVGNGAPVSVAATLSNGNATDFQHSVSDWQAFLPGLWIDANDPVIAASGDGPDDGAAANGVAASIVAADPALFLFLGDVYEEGTFVENRNMYGASSMDGGPGTLWGTLANKTQPTIGNHEHKHLADFTDYWHGRPMYTSFTFGGALFLDLNSSASLQPGSPQYGFVQQALQGAPDCVISFFHIPVLSGGKIATNKQAIWALLADEGGDLVLNGHNHFLMEYEPLADDLTTPGHMVELISGAGGHDVGPAKSDVAGRIAWSLGRTPGALYLTLVEAAAAGTASAVSWRFETTSGAVVRTGTVDC